MSNRVRFLWVAIICFGLGFATAQFSAVAPKVTYTPSERMGETIVQDQILDLNSVDHAASSQDHRQAAAQRVKQQLDQIHALIDQAPSEKVEGYLEQIFPRADFSSIQDKKKFSQRVLDEFVQSENDEQQDLAGQVIVNTQEKVPQHMQNMGAVYRSQQLFAHLDTLNTVQNSQQVFIRWIYRNTGEVLLFMPQNISHDSAQNWVSFAPSQGWKVGDYDVRYYQLNDDLKPIAQTSFKIHALVD